MDAPVKTIPPTAQQLWRHTFAATILIYVYALSYALLYSSTFSNVPMVTATALTGGMLIGLSFALSGICYYTNIFDTFIIYRKYIGLTGYFMALIYALALPVLYPDLYGSGLLSRWYEPEILLGITAMAIFTIMTIASHVKIIRMLGSRKWKLIMSCGYFAYTLLIVRAYILEHTVWIEWFTHPAGLPPPRLLLSIYAVSVILLRLSIPISKYLHHRKAVHMGIPQKHS